MPPPAPPQLSGMTKSPFPLVDLIMLGPLLACLNLYFGQPLPEYYVAIGLLVSVTVLCTDVISTIFVYRSTIFWIFQRCVCRCVKILQHF